RLAPVAPREADRANAERVALLAAPREALAAAFEAALGGRTALSAPAVVPAAGTDVDRVLASVDADGHAPSFVIRRAGDHHLLLEAGPAELDLGVRLWVHLLADRLRAAGAGAVREIVEGVRSLLVQVDE